LTANEALSRLLSGTDLAHRFTGDKTVAIMTQAAATREADPVAIDGSAADGGPSETRLPETVVTGHLTDNEGVAAQRASSALKVGAPILETPQSVSVVTSHQLEVQGINRMSEAFRYTPGIQAENFGPDTRLTFFRIRGFDSFQDALFKDGMKLSNPGFVIGYSLEPYGAERLEVPKGPASVLYGAGNPGGLVNYVTKRPRFTPFHEVIFETGSFERFQGQFDTTGPLNKEGTLAYRLTGLIRDSETQVDFVEDDRIYIAPALTWQPSDDTSVTLLTHYQRDRTHPSQRLPVEGTLFHNPNGEIPIERFTGEPGVDQYHRNEYSVGYLFNHRFNDTWQVRQNMRYYSNEVDDRTIFPEFLQGDMRTVTRSLYESFGEADGVTLDNQLVADFETGSVRHQVLGGLDFQYVQTQTLQTYGFGGPADLDVFDPVYGMPVPDAPVFKNEDAHQYQIGFYLQDHINLTDQWILTLGGRYDIAKTEIEDNLSGSTSEQDDKAFTGRVGVLYKSDIGVSPYASYMTSFLPIIGTDASGEPFDPETARQWEIGVKYQPKDWDSIFTLAYFNLTREDFTTFAPDFSVIQQGKGKSRGIEFEARSDFDFGVSLIASYTYLDTELTESAFPGEVGEPLPYTPKHQAGLWVDYLFQNGPLKDLRVGGGVRYIGSNYANLFQRDNEDIKVPDVFLFDAAATTTKATRRCTSPAVHRNN